MITHCHRRSPPWRAVLWGAALLLLLLPWVAMQFSGEIDWDLGDFVVFGGMLVLACGSFELAARFITSRRYRWWAGGAIVLAFLLVWAELAVGLISEGE
jgi:hypothetical protein